MKSISRGLLYRNEENNLTQIQILQHDNNTVSSHILYDNIGALSVHATARNTTVADILQPNYVPPIVHSFFPLNDVKNHQGTSQPLLAVQVTELLDGVFIAFNINHIVADDKSFWLFVNSWAELSRGSPPSLQSFFLDGIDRPIRFPFTNLETATTTAITPPPVRAFHFTKQKIAELKAKANAEAEAEANSVKISSLQALLTHFWRCVVRCKRIDQNEEVYHVLMIDIRARMVPAQAEDYFGNCVMFDFVRMKAGELLQRGGLGKGALEMNTVVSLASHEKAKNQYESWVRIPILYGEGNYGEALILTVSSSPRFNIYGNDFGWGKPVAVRSGGACNNGSIALFAAMKKPPLTLNSAFLMNIWRPWETTLSYYY